MSIPSNKKADAPSGRINLLAEARSTVKKLLDRVSLVALTLGFVAIVVSVFRMRSEGLRPNVMAALIIYPAVALVIFLRKRIPDTVALSLLVGIVSVSALINFVTLGLASVSFLILAACAIITLSVFGRRPGFVYLAGSVLAVALIRLAHARGVIPPPKLSPGYLDASSTWLMQTSTYVVFTVIILVTADNIRNRLGTVLDRQARHADELREREEKYRLLAENMHDVVFVQDMDLRFTYANPAVKRMFGYDPGEVYSLTMDRLMGPESLESALARFNGAAAELRAGGEAALPEMEFEYIRKDGSTFTGACRPSFIRDGDGNLAGLQGIMTDISERKKTERALQESEAKFRTAIESLPFEFFTIRPDGRYGMQNAECRRNWGDVTEKTPEEVAPDKATLALWKANNVRARAGEVVSTEMRFAHGGEDKTYLNIISPILHDGRPGGILGININITDQRRAESDLRAALEEKDVLLRELYHRTKNNMQVIHSMLSLQAAGTSDPAVLNMFKDIQGRIQAMSLVHQKLYTSKALSHINLAEYVGELFTLLGRGYRDRAARTTLSLDIAPLPMSIDIAVPCGLVLNELITNSFKYAFPDGRDGVVSVSAHRDDGGLVTLGYADDGAGLPDGFDFRAAGTLGMQVIHGIVEHQLQGSVAFRNGNGLACTIRFRDNQYGERV